MTAMLLEQYGEVYLSYCPNLVGAELASFPTVEEEKVISAELLRKLSEWKIKNNILFTSKNE